MLALFLSAIFFASIANADFRFDSVGFHAAETVKKVDDMHQNGIVLRYRVINPSKRFWIPSSLDLSVGALELGTETGSFVSFGPSYRFALSKWGEGRLFADLGVHPTYVSESIYGDRPLGGNFHFTSYAGFGAYLGRQKKISILVRYQHTSNAGFENPNPGLDMVGLTFSYHFGKDQQIFSAVDSQRK